MTEKKKTKMERVSDKLGGSWALGTLIILTVVFGWGYPPALALIVAVAVLLFIFYWITIE